jgi:superfamily I DNA/RNA helicase
VKARLNPAQRAAVEHGDGPLLVLAGAGSGKTRVITERIARLIRSRAVPPETILAVSFTNKAANEMQERLARLIGPEAAGRVWLSTFHSFGVRFLREEIAALGYGKRFAIFDQGDSLGLVRNIVHRGADRRLDAAAVLARISLWKNRFLEPEGIPESDFEYDLVAKTTYREYEATMRNMRAVDFDDLVLHPVRILAGSSKRRDKWRARFAHVLVDEFQDTNRSQLELVRLLTGEGANICVVGDDDQSIYGWRGAEVGNILEFETIFPGAAVVKLEQNYRSSPEILTVANAVISSAKGRRHAKTLRATRGSGASVSLWAVPDAAEEAKLVAAEIRRLAGEGTPLRAMAVLYRSAAWSRLFEEELRIAGVAYRIYGGSQLFDKKEVKDALGYLRLVAHPDDELALRRIINSPPRGIGASSVEQLGAFAESHGISFARAFESAEALGRLPDGARQGAAALARTLKRARASVRGGDLAKTVRELFEDAGLFAELSNAAEPSTRKRLDNLHFLVGSVERFARQGVATGRAGLAEFVQRTMLHVDQETEDASDTVTLSTLHTAKGLEFDVVFLVGCVEGQLPHARTTDPKVTEASPTDVEEERRLFYVGITRARDRLYIVRPERAVLRGRPAALAPSRFLEAVPAEAVTESHKTASPSLAPADVAALGRALLARLAGG